LPVTGLLDITNRSNTYIIIIIVQLIFQLPYFHTFSLEFWYQAPPSPRALFS